MQTHVGGESIERKGKGFHDRFERIPKEDWATIQHVDLRAEEDAREARRKRLLEENGKAITGVRAYSNERPGC